MQIKSSLAVFIAICAFAPRADAQSQASRSDIATTSLCVLQEQAVQGKHQSVRVSGTYGPGFDHEVLQDKLCPASGTWVELELRSDENKEKLRKILNRSRRAYVVFEGEFYGPPIPDPNLPDPIHKSSHPGWGHLGVFKTKLVVYAIDEVRAVHMPSPTTE